MSPNRERLTGRDSGEPGTGPQADVYAGAFLHPTDIPHRFRLALQDRQWDSALYLVHITAQLRASADAGWASTATRRESPQTQPFVQLPAMPLLPEVEQQVVPQMAFSMACTLRLAPSARAEDTEAISQLEDSMISLNDGKALPEMPALRFSSDLKHLRDLQDEEIMDALDEYELAEGLSYQGDRRLQRLCVVGASPSMERMIRGAVHVIWNRVTWDELVDQTNAFAIFSSIIRCYGKVIAHWGLWDELWSTITTYHSDRRLSSEEHEKLLIQKETMIGEEES